MEMPLLQVKNITKYFGGIKVLSSVDFDLFPGDILGIIGPNGAGKTTLFNIITGTHRPDSGKVIYKSMDITGHKPHELAKMGLGRSFQHTTLFSNLSVFQNVLLSQHLTSQIGFVGSLFHTRKNRMDESIMRERTLDLMKFTGIDVHKDTLAKNLSHGYQKTLNLAISLGTNTEVTLLDEPFAALSPKRVEEIQDLIVKIRKKGISVAIIEHNMKALFAICNRVIVLSAGCKIAEGTPENIGENPDAIEAYLGKAFGE